MIENEVFVNELFCQLERGEILHTISIAKAVGLSPDEFRRRLGDDILTSLNHDREYIASRDYVSEHCDRKGFWSKDGKVFHAKGGISQVLEKLIHTPWGITETEALKLTGRECARKLCAMVEANEAKRASINGVWVYGRVRRFDLQLKERMSNVRVKIPSNDEEADTMIIPMEEVMKTLSEENLHTETLVNLTASLVGLLKSASYRDMEHIIGLDARIASICGVDKAAGLDHTTLCKRFGDLQEITLKRLFTKLVRELQQVGVIKGKYLVVDATHLFAWASKKTQDDRSLPFADWGMHLDYFYGYKDRIKKVFERWGDRIETVEQALRYFGQRLLTEFGAVLGTDEESYIVHALKERMNRHLRVGVERVWSRIKFATDIEHPMFRKPDSIRKRVYLVFIAMLLVARTAIRMGIPEAKRRFASVY